MMLKIIGQLSFCFMLAITSMTATAAEVSTTTIVGDQELPQVLFILPWQQVDSQIPATTPPLEYTMPFGSVERAEFAQLLRLQPKQQRFHQ